MTFSGADRGTRRRARPAFGTLLVLTLRGAPDRAEADKAIGRAFAEAARIHAAMSRQDGRSDVAAIRCLRPGESVDVRPETREVLKLALDIAEDSDGAFDPVAPGAAGREAFWRDVVLASDGRVSVRRSLEISLDGIAKGFAADRLCAVLREAGDVDAIVDAGGDLALSCCKPERIGVRDPGRPGRMAREVLLAKGGVASSGAYGGVSELWAREGRRVWPGGVTVTAPCCAVADAMTKIAALDPHAPFLARWGANAISLERRAA
jgi:thiamine biosynthesis lipoprotein